MTDKTVLLVKDEDTITVALEYMMQRRGYRFCHVDDGANAMAAMEREHPCAVIVDVTLPSMSGYEICQKIRGTDGLKDTKVVMISDRGGKVEKQKCLAIGADDFYCNPFSVNDLAECVVALTGGAGHD